MHVLEFICGCIGSYITDQTKQHFYRQHARIYKRYCRSDGVFYLYFFPQNILMYNFFLNTSTFLQGITVKILLLLLLFIEVSPFLHASLPHPSLGVPPVSVLVVVLYCVYTRSVVVLWYPFGMGWFNMARESGYFRYTVIDCVTIQCSETAFAVWR